MCRVLKIQRSGFYAWLDAPLSARAREDQRLIGKIRYSYEQSQGTYGSPRILSDLREGGETCGKHRVARLMRQWTSANP
jgi:putative transposase